MNTRNRHLDLLKGIAITLVICGHCIQFGSGAVFYDNTLFYDNIIFKIIYSFHMPLFALISGYFLFFSVRKYNFTALVKRRFQQLLLPVFIVFFLYYSFIVIIHRNEFSPTDYLSWYLSSCYSFLWFLWITFFASILFSFTYHYLKDNLLIHMLLIVIILITPDGLIPAVYKFVYPYFLIGYCFSKHNIAKCTLWKKCNSFWGSFSILFAYFILFLLYSRDSYVYTTGIYILSDFPSQLFIDLYRYLTGFMGALCLIIFIRKIPAEKLSSQKYAYKIFFCLGQYSSFVYMFQQSFVSYILQRVTARISPSYLFNFIEMLTIILTSLLSIWILSHSKVTARFLLGRTFPHDHSDNFTTT